MPLGREHTRKGKRCLGFPWHANTGGYGLRKSRSRSQHRRRESKSQQSSILLRRVSKLLLTARCSFSLTMARQRLFGRSSRTTRSKKTKDLGWDTLRNGERYRVDSVALALHKK